MKLKDLKQKAQDLGTKALNSGLKAIPAADQEFMKFMLNEVPENRRLMMYRNWSKGWHSANASVNGGV
jgi:hypothetical protein